MPRLVHACQAIALAAGLAAVAGNTLAEETTPVTDDTHAWLEDVTGEKQLQWVRTQNAKAEAEIAATPDFKQLESRILKMLDSDAKIPYVEKIGDHYYNFWKDSGNARGVWRRTTLEEFRKPAPAWDTIIDLDALNKAENENWVWHGANCLRPTYTRCLVSLSRGGADADVTREFDVDLTGLAVCDTTGAGDAFTAGFLREWDAGRGLESAVAAGHAAARAVVGGAGADAWETPTP